MAKPYLEVTCRGGKALAAYLYVNRRPGDTAAAVRQLRADYPAAGPVALDAV